MQKKAWNAGIGKVGISGSQFLEFVLCLLVGYFLTVLLGMGIL